MERSQQIESLFQEALRRRTKTGPSRESRAIAIAAGSSSIIR
jgi:hypothetical protein